MARKAVVDAVEAYLAANWSACPVIGPNGAGTTPEDGAPYIVAQYPVAGTVRMVHQPYYREHGSIRFVIHVGRGAGIDQALAWADDLAALFRFKAFGGVRTQTPSSPMFDDEQSDGNYFWCALIVPYRYDWRD